MKLHFLLSKFGEFSSKPVVSFMSFRIWGPSKAIDQLHVTFDGVALPLWNSTKDLTYTLWIPQGGGANFRIPSDLEIKKNSKVKVYDGKKLLKTAYYSTLHIGETGRL